MVMGSRNPEKMYALFKKQAGTINRRGDSIPNGEAFREHE
jgi:hypothetical protein